MNQETAQRRCVTPRVNVLENDEVFTIEAEFPGVPKDGATVEVNDRELTLRGRRTDETGDGTVRMRERILADYYRAFTLGPAIDTSNVEAKMVDGVLSVTLHKSAELKPRIVNVN